MKKLFSLIKATLSENMNLFKINTKNSSKLSKILLPIFLCIMMFISIYSYANMIIEPLTKVHLEYILLSLFVIFSFFLTLTEGIYKSGSLLFKCKDDNLLLSLPIKRSTVLFIRVFKFYVFELIYNSLFMLPAMILYTRYVNVDVSYYIVSLIMLLLLPIIPIIISVIIGSIISSLSSRFKYKNIIQTIFTTTILVGILYLSFNLDGILKSLASNASSINDIITRLYYPAGAYVKMITKFNVLDLIIFIVINLGLFIITIFILSKRYFKVNSKLNESYSSNNKGKYKITYNKRIVSLMKKEFKRFVNSPVFIVNAGFGLVLFIIGCILLIVKFNSLTNILGSIEIDIDINTIKSYIPVIIFCFVCFTSFMTSITSSMISLEGKSFSILKSLPISPITIIMSKVLSAAMIMIPVILIGDITLFIYFKFNIIEIILLLIPSITLPFISEMIGIIVNLKYPKMDADNDTEVVKQSISSMIAVFTGMIVSFLTIFLLVTLISKGLSNYLILGIFNLFYILLLLIIIMYMKKYSVRDFNSINI